jgi:hypothetical protein
MCEGGASWDIEGGPKPGCDARPGGPLLPGRDILEIADQVDCALWRAINRGRQKGELRGCRSHRRLDVHVLRVKNRQEGDNRN